jgi:integrase
LVTALRAHKDRQRFERVKAGERWQESGLVFTSTTGTALDARNLTRVFKRHLAAASLPADLRFYDIPMTCATPLQVS